MPSASPATSRATSAAHRERPPDERRDRAAREDVEAGGADVPLRRRLWRRRARRLRRRSGLAGHGEKLRAEPRRPTRTRSARRSSAAASVSRSVTRARRASSGRTTRSSARRRASSEIRVVEVHVDDLRQRRGRASARARSPSECVVGIARSARPDGQLDRARELRATPTAPRSARYGGRCARGVQST